MRRAAEVALWAVAALIVVILMGPIEPVTSYHFGLLAILLVALAAANRVRP